MRKHHTTLPTVGATSILIDYHAIRTIRILRSVVTPGGRRPGVPVGAVLLAPSAPGIEDVSLDLPIISSLVEDLRELVDGALSVALRTDSDREL